jgi:hypothetical protein
MIGKIGHPMHLNLIKLRYLQAMQLRHSLTNTRDGAKSLLTTPSILVL